MSSTHPSPSKNEREIFNQALEISTADGRAEFLERVCGGDRALRLSVEALLLNHKTSAPSDKTDDILHPWEKAGEKIGDQIGQYKLVEKLGEGGCGTVFVAEQQALFKRQVALKVIKLGMDSKQVVRRFNVEQQVLAKLDHSNIAKVFDAGFTESGRPYFVMELVRGKKITDYADDKKLSIEGRLQLFLKVCRPIQFAHERGVLHRDIKPSNVLITEEQGDPLPKVIDFGIAKAIGNDQIHTTISFDGQLLGTPNYMSPEQVRSGSGEIDVRSDVYSLGVLLYELIVGCPPLDLKGVGGFDLARIIIEVAPSPPLVRIQQFQPEQIGAIASLRNTNQDRFFELLGGEAAKVVMVCLEKMPECRYASVDSLAFEIERVLKSFDTNRQPKTPIHSQSTILKTNPESPPMKAEVKSESVPGKVNLWFKKTLLGLKNPALEEFAFILQVATDAAKCDGPLSQAEQETLKALAKFMCGGDEDISKSLFEFTNWSKSPEEMASRKWGFALKTNESKYQVFRNILTILLSDGLPNVKETQWLYRLGNTLNFSKEEFLTSISFFVCRESGPDDVNEWRNALTPIVMDGSFSRMVVSDEAQIWRWLHEMAPDEIALCSWCGKQNALPNREEFFYARCGNCYAYLGLTEPQSLARSAMLNHPDPLPEPRNLK